MQNEITKPSKCFHKNGALMQRGWARRPLLEYNREDIAAKWYRIKAGYASSITAPQPQST